MLHPAQVFRKLKAQLAAQTKLKALSDAVTATLTAQAARAEQVVEHWLSRRLVAPAVGGSACLFPPCRPGALTAAARLTPPPAADWARCATGPWPPLGTSRQT